MNRQEPVSMSFSKVENIERRRGGRVEFATRCWCENPGLTQYVHVTNVSEGGAFIRTHTPFKVGEKVNVRWAFPGAPLELEAIMQVVWKCDGSKNPAKFPGMGLKFLSIDETTSEALEKFIHSSRCGTA